MWTVNFQMFKSVLEKAEEPEIKLPTSDESSKKQESYHGYILSKQHITVDLGYLDEVVFISFLHFKGAFLCTLHLLLSHSVMSNSLQPHGLQHTRLPCPLPSPGSCSNSCPLSRWCHPTVSSPVDPFSSCLYLSQPQGLFQWVSSSHQVDKVLVFQLQHQPFHWIFRVDFL